MSWRPSDWEQQKELILAETFGHFRGLGSHPYQSDLFFDDGMEAGADAMLSNLLQMGIGCNKRGVEIYSGEEMLQNINRKGTLIFIPDEEVKDAH